MATFEQGRAALPRARRERLIPREIEDALASEIPVERFSDENVTTGAVVANAIMSALSGIREHRRAKLAGEAYQRQRDEHDLRMQALRRSTERVPVDIEGQRVELTPDAYSRYISQGKPRPVGKVPIGPELRGALGVSSTEMHPDELRGLVTMKRPRGTVAGTSASEDRQRATSAYRMLQSRVEQEVVRGMSPFHANLADLRRMLMGDNSKQRDYAEKILGLTGSYTAADINVAQQLYLNENESRVRNAVLGTMGPEFRELEARLVGPGGGASSRQLESPAAPTSDPYDELLRLLEGEDEEEAP